MPSQQCYFLHGSDTYRSHRALAAITQRFLAKQNSMADLQTLDMEETPLETLKQTLLAMPFFVTHRLFILKHGLTAPKATQEGMVKLLPQLGESTVVVCYESRPCDKRLALYKWLAQHAKNQEFASPKGYAFRQWVDEVLRPFGVAAEPAVVASLEQSFAGDTWQLALECQKLACWVCSQARNQITVSDLAALGSQEAETSAFALSDALRGQSLGELVARYRSLLRREDPMLIAGTLGSFVRTMAKLWLSRQQGTVQPSAVAQATKLNPYVIKLSQASADRLSASALKQSYRELLHFDMRVKAGVAPADIGLLLLLVRLHGTLKRG